MVPDPRLRYANCEFPISSLKEIASLLESRLKARIPTSLVRLGDGEGAVLSRPETEEVLVWPRLQYHFGAHVTSGQLAYLADLLVGAIQSADVLGIRDDLINVSFSPGMLDLKPEAFLDQFRRSFQLRPVETGIVYTDAIRLALLHGYLTTATFPQEMTYSSAWIHYLLSSDGVLLRLLKGQKRVGLISSRPELARIFTQRFGLQVDFFEVPDRYGDLGTGYTGPPQFPDIFEQTLEALAVHTPGQLFLVGAGICGKIYCHKIKQLGGIGLDIGSVCDSWLGINSRKLVMRSLYNASELPSSLLLSNQ